MKFVIVLLLVGIATVSCIPKREGNGGKGDGEGKEKGNGGGKGDMKRKPCKGWDNIETCECANGDTYDNKDDIKDNCGKGSKNPIESCECATGEVWTNPGKGDGSPKKNKPCGKGKNIDSCVCKDGETYEGKAVIKKCKKNKKSNNKAVHCTCKDGTEWPTVE